jgi:hypothetical protein
MFFNSSFVSFVLLCVKVYTACANFSVTLPLTQGELLAPWSNSSLDDMRFRLKGLLHGAKFGNRFFSLPRGVRTATPRGEIFRIHSILRSLRSLRLNLLTSLVAALPRCDLRGEYYSRTPATK